MEGLRVSHFPKFPKNFPQFSNLKKLFSFLKCRSFKFFFPDSNEKINSKLQEMKKKLHIDFHLKNFSKFSEVRKFFFWKLKKNALGPS